MLASPRSRLLVSLLCVGAAGVIACSDDLFGGDSRTYGSGDGGGGLTTATGAKEEQLFRALESDLVLRCGGGSGACHITGEYAGNPPPFLKGPDAYRTIKATPGIIVADISASGLIAKGDHAGPRLDDQLRPRVIEWLTAEARLLVSARPASPAIDVIIGENDVDLSALASGVNNVHLKFAAALTGTILTLSNVRLSTAPGEAVHIQHLSFGRVPADLNQPESNDPADSFSNLDTTLPGGAESPVPPGRVLFTGWVWQTGDKLRVQVTKLERGVITEAAAPITCVNPDGFAAVAAALGPCTGAMCHRQGGNGQGALDLAGLLATPPDYAATCPKVKNKIDFTNPNNSRIFMKTDGRIPHAGGTNGGAQLKTDITAAIAAGVF